MKSGTVKIEKRQFLFTVVCFLQCVTIHISMMKNLAVQSSWLVLTAAALSGVVSILLIGALDKVYGRKSLGEMTETGFGKIIGKLISVIYVIYFFWKFCDTVFEFSSFVTDTILPKTPEWVILILIIGLCVFAVNFGITVVSSIGFLLTVTVFVITVGSALFLASQYELGNFLPQFAESQSNYLKGFAIASVEPFGELIVFLTVIPHVKNIRKSGTLIKTMLISLVLGYVTFLINAIRDTGTLGVLVKYFIFPTFESIRMINIGEIFSRVEIFYAGMLMILAFFKASIWLFATCEMFKSVTDGRRSKNNHLIAGAAALVLTVIGNPRILNSVYTDTKLNITINVAFEFVLPIILLIAGFFVSNREKEGKFQNIQ
ncbi:MAG: hypothetical protein E7384_00610 [Ruminococcaceae bacterium]|nr:hypothetical protein [Oscillospiraceae bacterium]